MLPVSQNPGTVWRIGYAPNPWVWTDWKFANTDGRFDGRWDDPEGQYRTLYVGDSAVACFIEVLAKFRPDPAVTAELNAIESDEVDEIAFPTLPSGRVSTDWVDNRRIGSAELKGSYVRVTTAETVAALWPAWVSQAHRVGLTDFDTSALKDSGPRALTQAISRYLYETTIAGGPAYSGVEFTSRHGDDLRLWAIYEYPGHTLISPELSNAVDEPLTMKHAALHEAMGLLQLTWADE
jgi:hypothetical protein